MTQRRFVSLSVSIIPSQATEEEEQRKREARRLTKALLEAAFEGDSEALVKLMAESEVRVEGGT